MDRPRTGLHAGAVEPLRADAVQRAYDVAAVSYVERFGDDLARLPLDREMLDRSLALAGAGDDGWVLEAGCGPAPAAGHFGDRAPLLVGIDLSEAMLAVAGDRTPGLRRAQGDLRRLPLRDGCCALVIACYTLQHLPRGELGPALAELGRVLGDKGVLLVATHLGEGEVHIDDFLGHPVAGFGGCYHQRDEMVGLLTGARFEVVDEQRRGPLPSEADTERLYLLARRR